jgi:hypothetical protein
MGTGGSDGMSQILALELPNALAAQARSLAAATNRRLEDAVVDWIGRAVTEPAVESLPDAELLALCEATLEAAEQAELSSLLARLREERLAETDRGRLDQLMGAYRRGLVLKARAVKEAVTRGLRSPLDDHAA